MPLRLYPPDRKHRTWRVRGTYLGQQVDRSTGATDKKVAAKLLAQWRQDIECGQLTRRDEPTWASAVISYVQAHGDGENRYLEPLTRHFGLKPLRDIMQADIDAAAEKLYPGGKASSRNRSVYTPVMSVMTHAGFPFLRTPNGGHQKIARPKGAQGDPRLVWLEPVEAVALLGAARADALRLDREAELKPQISNLKRAADSAHRFHAYMLFLLCTGVRFSEARRVRYEDLNLVEASAWCGKTKNGKPRTVHLPRELVEALSALKPRANGSVFPFYRYMRLRRVAEMAGVVIPPGVAYHIFRHTWARWMRKYANLDTSGLVATGAWLSHSAARVYEHLDITEEAKKADLLPFLRKDVA